MSAVAIDTRAGRRPPSTGRRGAERHGAGPARGKAVGDAVFSEVVAGVFANTDRAGLRGDAPVGGESVQAFA